MIEIMFVVAVAVGGGLVGFRFGADWERRRTRAQRAVAPYRRAGS